MLPSGEVTSVGAVVQAVISNIRMGIIYRFIRFNCFLEYDGGKLWVMVGEESVRLFWLLGDD